MLSAVVSTTVAFVVPVPPDMSAVFPPALQAEKREKVIAAIKKYGINAFYTY